MAMKNNIVGASESPTRKRALNIELLRIIAIFLITLNHINTYCDVKHIDAPIIANTFLSLFFGVGGKFGCNIFLIISSFYLTNKDIKLESILKILLQTLFYLLALDVNYLIVGGNISLGKLGQQMIRVFTGADYWYSFSYIGLLIMIPVLKMIIDRIRNPLLILSVIGLFLSIIPTFTVEYLTIGRGIHVIFYYAMKSSLIWFWYVFGVIYFCRTIYKKFSRKKSLWLALFFANYLIMFAVSSYGFVSKLGNGDIYYKWIRDISSLFCILAAVSLFMFFQNIHINWKFINFISPCVYGIYLLQCHPLMRNYIFNLVPFSKISAESWLYLPISCLFAIAVIFVGCIIEYPRKRLEELLFGNKGIKNLMRQLNAGLSRLYISIERMIIVRKK